VLYGSPKHKEPAFAFVSRIAAVAGVAASDFGKDIGVSFQSILGGSETGFAERAKLIGCDLDDLTRWTPSKFSSSRRVLNGHQFPSRSLLASVVRGCPVCLREDTLDTTVPNFRAMIYRANWLIPHVSICLKHEHPLVPYGARLSPRYDMIPRSTSVRLPVRFWLADLTAKRESPLPLMNGLPIGPKVKSPTSYGLINSR
jgi:hypothetical protein